MENLLTIRQKSDIEIITRMYRQQKNHFENNDPRESVKDRIVSISKPYVRPIVRGKEGKSVEFGAKCNNIHEVLQGERDTDIIRQAWPSFLREER